MWIEYELNEWKGLINFRNVSAIYHEIDGVRHSRIIFLMHSSKLEIPFGNETEDAQEVFTGFKLALSGYKAVIQGIGHITPLDSPNKHVEAYFKIKEIEEVLEGACVPEEQWSSSEVEPC